MCIFSFPTIHDMMIVLLVAWIYNLLVVNGTITCGDAYECASQVYDVTEQIRCFGFHACDGATITQDVALSLNCYGVGSCVDASITAIGVTTTILCYGLFSCRNAAIEHNGVNHLYCRGDQSCVQASINFLITDKNIYCDGYLGCAGATIHTPTNIYFYGAWSGQDATIYSTDDYSLFLFAGPYSGCGATVYCHQGGECVIRCEGTSCINLTAECDDGGSGGDNCTLSVTCYSGVHVCDLCPNGDNTDRSLAPNITQIGSFTTDENSEGICDSGSSTGSTTAYDVLACDDYLECQSQTIQTTNGIICCQAFYSCRYADNITSEISDAAAEIVDNVGIRCDASHSCLWVDRMIQSMNNDINLYFTGALATSSSAQLNTVIRGPGWVTRSNESETDIYCSGFRSCYIVTLDTGRRIFSIAKSGMENVTVINFEIVYCYGREACEQSVFSNVKELHCASQYSCYLLNVNDVDRLIGYSYLGARLSDFTNVNEYVFGIGQNVFSYSNFSANRQSTDVSFECDGNYCCRYCMVDGFSSVTGGQYGLYESTFVSISDELNAIGYAAFRYSTLNNNGDGFDNTNFQVLFV